MAEGKPKDIGGCVFFGASAYYAQSALGELDLMTTLVGHTVLSLFGFMTGYVVSWLGPDAGPAPEPAKATAGAAAAKPRRHAKLNRRMSAVHYENLRGFPRADTPKPKGRTGGFRED